MTRVRRFEPGETDHIIQVDDTWECSICKERYRPRRRIRFHLHKWKRKHVECAVPPEVKYERLVEKYHPDKITPAIASSMLKLEAELGIESLVPDKFRK